MAVFTGLPTLQVDFIKPGSMSFDTPGGGLGSPRNGNGQSITVEMSGGGLVTGKYENCFIQSPEQHEYINWLAARLNGSHRYINVPVLTDWSGPFAQVQGAPQPILSVPHSDDTPFDDGAEYTQNSVYGQSTKAAGLNAGIIDIRVVGGGRPLRYSDWFSIYHRTKGWRLYRYWEVLSHAGQDYRLAISPPLRESISASTLIEFVRPRCVMKFAFGFTMPWEVRGFYRSSPSFEFEEAF